MTFQNTETPDTLEDEIHALIDRTRYACERWLRAFAGHEDVAEVRQFLNAQDLQSAVLDWLESDNEDAIDTRLDQFKLVHAVVEQRLDAALKRLPWCELIARGEAHEVLVARVNASGGEA